MTITAEGNGKSASYDLYEKADENGDLLITVDSKDADGSTASTKLDVKDNSASLKVGIKNADGSTLNMDGQFNTDENDNSTGIFTLSAREADGSSSDFSLDCKVDADGNSEMNVNLSGKYADGGETGGHFSIEEDSSGNGTVDGKFSSKEADGSTFDFDMSANTDKDGNTNMEMNFSSKGADGSESSTSFTGNSDKDDNMNLGFTISSKESDGSTCDLKASVKTENGEEKAEISGTYDNKKTGDKGKISAVNDGKSLKVSVSGTDEEGKDYSFEGEKDENGFSLKAGSDNEYLIVNRDGSYEFEEKATANYIRTDKDHNVEACHVTNEKTGVTYDFKDGTGFISTGDGEKVLWNYDNGTLAIYSSDCSYTVDKQGNLYRNGEPVKVGGKWVNVIKGYTPEDVTEEETEAPTEEETEEPTEEPEPTDPPTEAPTDKPEEGDIHSYLGKWSHPGSVSTTWELSLKGDTLYLAIGGYSTDPNEKVEAPCTYEFRDGKLYVSTAMFSGAVVFTYNSSSSLTVTASGETVTMRRLN